MSAYADVFVSKRDGDSDEWRYTMNNGPPG